ncbi:hypothetical protein Hanom_Chr05g00438171 [Helianthus anomalus]
MFSPSLQNKITFLSLAQNYDFALGSTDFFPILQLQFWPQFKIIFAFAQTKNDDFAFSPLSKIIISP